MDETTIIKKVDKIGAKIEIGSHDACLLTMRNGWQWSGQPINKDLARLIIEVLEEYLEAK